MRFSALAAALLPVGYVSATLFTVKVGPNKQFVFEPNTISNVQVGDQVQFQFQGGNHSVTQSTFPNPCSNITDPTGLVTGADSGYNLVDDPANLPVWQITINNASAPLWFFCRQGKHCQNGMVFSINPTAEKSHELYTANAAKSAAVNGSPDPNAAAATPPAPNNGTNTGTDPNAPPTSSDTNAPPVSSGTDAPAISATSGAPPVSPTGNSSSPSASTDTGAGADPNGAGVLRLGSSAALMSVVGLALGLFL